MLESCNDASVLRPSNKAIIFAIRGLESWQDPPTRHSKVLEEFLKGQSVLVGSSIDINEPSNSKQFSKLISSSLRQSSKATTDPSGTWQDSQESLAANIALLNGRRKPLQDDCDTCIISIAPQESKAGSNSGKKSIWGRFVRRRALFNLSTSKLGGHELKVVTKKLLQGFPRLLGKTAIKQDVRGRVQVQVIVKACVLLDSVRDDVGNGERWFQKSFQTKICFLGVILSHWITFQPGLGSLGVQCLARCLQALLDNCSVY